MTESNQLTAADDGFHTPDSTDPWWTETAWFSVDLPERELSVTVYPFFRPNLGVSSLTVAVWDASAVEPWRVPYCRSLWHLPMPVGDLTDLAVGGLRYKQVAPLESYEVGYAEGDRLTLDLRYDALRPPHAPRRGHLDQACRVQGTIVLNGERIDVDGLAMRDRSWGLRPDDRSTVASYSYGIASADDEWLAVAVEVEGVYRIIAGYLVADGEKAALVSGERRVTTRRDGYPVAIEVEATDERGRRLEVAGRCRNRFANQATPGMFAWMSLTEWRWGTIAAHGEDQDIWSPDRL